MIKKNRKMTKKQRVYYQNLRAREKKQIKRKEMIKLDLRMMKRNLALKNNHSLSLLIKQRRELSL